MKPLRDIETRVFNRINPAVRFSVSRYVFSVGIFVAIVVFGIIALLNLGVSQTPSMNMPAVLVSATYSGATPSVVDKEVTQVIESAVSSIAGISEISSTSETGSSTIFIRFTDTTDKYAATNQVSSAVAGAVSDLPSGMDTPTVKALDPNSDPVIQIGVSGGAASLADVNDYVDNDFVPVLQRVSGVGDVSTDGGPSKEFQVLLDPSRLSLYNLTPKSVATAIESAVLNSSIGSITQRGSSLSFSSREQPTDPAAIQSIIIDSTRSLTVSDVASVRETPSVENYARINGKPVVLVSVKKTTDANTVAVVNGVRQAVAR
ncbi:MAG TPA: efflux RND transporter permease subunit, partial [Spirochaetia bacterium]